MSTTNSKCIVWSHYVYVNYELYELCLYYDICDAVVALTDMSV